MARSGFSYQRFVQGVIDSNPAPHLPVGMMRAAVMAGAPHEGDALRMRLREACDTLANLAQYKRLREKGVTGYQYQRVAPDIEPDNDDDEGVRFR